MLADDAYQWFEENGGLTREWRSLSAHGPLARNTEDLADMYAAWRGRAPTVDAMLKDAVSPIQRANGQPFASVVDGNRRIQQSECFGAVLCPVFAMSACEYERPGPVQAVAAWAIRLPV